MLTSLLARRCMGVETLILRACLRTATDSGSTLCEDEAEASEEGSDADDSDTDVADDDGKAARASLVRL